MPAGEFVGGLLHAVTVAHVKHLQSKSYSQHKALEALYDGLGGLVDALAESYQGLHGLIEDYPATFAMPSEDDTKWVRGLGLWVDDLRAEMGNDTEIQNQIDEIQSLINQTNYKLTFLG